MNKLGKELISNCCKIFLVFSLVFCSFNLNLSASTIKQNDFLIEKIAKDFSTKFCNGVGFGLSEESAFNFAMKENRAIFMKKKGIENIDRKAAAEKVSNSVLDKCGYPLNLAKEEMLFNFRKVNLN